MINILHIRLLMSLRTWKAGWQLMRIWTQHYRVTRGLLVMNPDIHNAIARLNPSNKYLELWLATATWVARTGNQLLALTSRELFKLRFQLCHDE